MRLPAHETAFLPLHPGEGFRHHRHTGRGPAEGLGDLFLFRGEEQDRDDPVRHGLDPAHRGHPEHPHHGHHPVAPGKHGQARRPCECPPRRIQRAGVHGPRSPVPYLARAPRNSQCLPACPGRLQRQEYSQIRRPPLRQLVAAQTQGHRQLPEGHVRGGGYR